MKKYSDITAILGVIDSYGRADCEVIWKNDTPYFHYHFWQAIYHKKWTYHPKDGVMFYAYGFSPNQEEKWTMYNCMIKKLKKYKILPPKSLTLKMDKL